MFVGAFTATEPWPSLPTTTSVIGINAGGTATASVTLTNAGAYDRFTTQGGSSNIRDWVNGGSVYVSQFEARWTTTSGTLTSGTAGSWLALSTSRTWSKSATGTNSTVIGTLEIRRVSNSAVVATSTVTLEADGV